jgi:cell division protein FtsX
LARMPPPTRVVRLSRAWWGWATAVTMSRPRSINSPVSSTLLLVGAIGIANVTVIGVLERRGEIGLCSALGAGRRHIRYQFLTASVLLSAVGGIAGVAIGSRSPSAMP